MAIRLLVQEKIPLDPRDIHEIWSGSAAVREATDGEILSHPVVVAALQKKWELAFKAMDKVQRHYHPRKN